MLNFSGLGLVTKRRAMAELEPERETVDSEKVQPGEFTKYRVIQKDCKL